MNLSHANHFLAEEGKHLPHDQHVLADALRQREVDIFVQQKIGSLPVKLT